MDVIRDIFDKLLVRNIRMVLFIYKRSWVMWGVRDVWSGYKRFCCIFLKV